MFCPYDVVYILEHFLFRVEQFSTSINQPLKSLLHFLFESFVRSLYLLNILSEMMVCLPHLSIDYEQGVSSHTVSLM